MLLGRILTILGAAVAPILGQNIQSGFEGIFRGDLHSRSARGLPAPGKKGAMLMNRIGPSSATLYVANADGTNERRLLNESHFDYHASFSPDGQWILFTSERGGDGNSDLYRCHPDGSGLEKLLATPSFEDAGAISPDGSQVAFVSTANGYKANIWILDLSSGEKRNLTNSVDVKGVPWSPDGYFSPSWSPDGKWIAFSSDRNTAWTGHGNGTGWEHTQELSIYVIKPDGSGFRQLATKPGYCLGQPKWSPDGTRVLFYEMTREATWGSHRPESLNSTTSQIVSVDFATGLDRVQETNSSTLKIYPQYVTDTEVGWLVKGPTSQAGLGYSSGRNKAGEMRSPAWSPDGQLVVYEKVDWTIRPMEKSLYSWDSEWDYRFTDVFPELSRQGKLAITDKQLGNSSIVTMNPDTSDQRIIFDAAASGELDPQQLAQGLAGAFQPAWSPDGAWIAFGLGGWFQSRATYTAWIYRVATNGSHYERLTDGSVNSGFPSYSRDGNFLVYREWGAKNGLRVMDLKNMSVRVLTTEKDNLPHYSPDGDRILFTRKTNTTNFDICTIRPDGNDLKVLTSSGANDAHAVWTADGRILWSSGMYGFRTEAATYDDTFQPYGQIFVMNADGSDKRILTDSMWEDSMPIYLPNEILD